METKAGQNGTDLPKAEIDTRAPFKSVKAAVSLFGEVAFTSDRSTVRKPKPPPPESGLPKETQLHLAKKELNKYREQLDNAAKTRTHALVELERVRRTFEELTNKLNAVNESKELALKATEVAKAQTKNLEDVSAVENSGHDGGWEQEFSDAREQYAIVVVELNAAKQELRRIRKDFEASTEAKLTAIYQEAKAKQLLDACNENVAQLSMEIRTSQESLTDVKLVTEQAQQEESKIRSEKDSSKQACKQALEETEMKMASLKKESDPQVHKTLEAKLAETASEIEAVQKEMEVARASDLELVTAMGAELDGAKGMLQKLAEEESWFRSLVDSLKMELGSTCKKQRSYTPEMEWIARVKGDADQKIVELSCSKQIFSYLPETLASHALRLTILCASSWQLMYGYAHLGFMMFDETPSDSWEFWLKMVVYVLVIGSSCVSAIIFGLAAFEMPGSKVMTEITLSYQLLMFFHGGLRAFLLLMKSVGLLGSLEGESASEYFCLSIGRFLLSVMMLIAYEKVVENRNKPNEANPE